MIAVTYDRPGEPTEVLKLIELKREDPGPGEVVVKVKQIPIVPAELATIRGLYRTPQKTPTSPGYSGQGSVIKLGQGVRSFKEGDEVLILPFKRPGWTNGCWKTEVVIDETEL